MVNGTKLVMTDKGIGRLTGSTTVEILDVPFSSLDEALRSGDASKLHDAPVAFTTSNDELTFEPPVQPGRYVIIGFNYPRHAAETYDFRKDSEDHNYEVPTELVWAAAPAALATSTAGRSIVLPADHADQVDYEGELGVVIGRKASRVSSNDAWGHIAALTSVNDVSARDVQFAALAAKEQGPTQGDAKTFPTFKPIGPAVLVPREQPTAVDLSITTIVNGETRQSGSTADMVWPIPALIELLSAEIDLEPGDVICTGSPDGVGFVSGRFLQPGDTVEIRIGDLVPLINTVTSEGSAS